MVKQKKEKVIYCLQIHIRGLRCPDNQRAREILKKKIIVLVSVKNYGTCIETNLVTNFDQSVNKNRATSPVLFSIPKMYSAKDK